MDTNSAISREQRWADLALLSLIGFYYVGGMVVTLIAAVAFATRY